MPPAPVVPADDLYARLEVDAECSFETIEVAWRALLKRHHPDIAGADGLELAKRINVAHDWLADRDLRARYDRERGIRSGRPPRWGRRPADGSPTGQARPAPRRSVTRDPAEELRRFLDRVGRLNRDELDRLSMADTSSIAFVASIRRFLAPEPLAALDAVESQVRTRLRSADWANGPLRDAVLAAAHELALGAFLDEHLAEPFRGRARDRLVRAWEAAIDQPRYGPNTKAVERFLARAAALTADEARKLARAAGRGRITDDPWPRGLGPDEDEGLRVSSDLAGRDAAARAAPALGELDRPVAARAERLLARTAHALVLRHGFRAEEFAALVAPWRAATGDPGTGRTEDRPAGPTVRRR
ncbi:MAG: DnaJ domain-containing protein [Chloroflexota bacterium]